MITKETLEAAAALVGRPVLYTRVGLATAQVVITDYRVNFGRVEYRVRDASGGERWARAGSIHKSEHEKGE